MVTIRSSGSSGSFLSGIQHVGFPRLRYALRIDIVPRDYIGEVMINDQEALPFTGRIMTLAFGAASGVTGVLNRAMIAHISAISSLTIQGDGAEFHNIMINPNWPTSPVLIISNELSIR